MNYAIIRGGIVENVILADPENVCLTCAGPSDGCRKYHPAAAYPGCECVPCGEGPNTADARTRPASRGDTAVKVTGALARTRPYDFEPAPKPVPVPLEPTVEERIAALEAKLAAR